MTTPTYEAYKAEATAKIRQYEAKLKEWEAELAAATEGTREDGAQLSAKAKEKLADLGVRLNECRDDAGEKATQAKAYAEAGFDEVERLFGELKTKISG